MLHTFSGADGSVPNPELIIDSQGSLYGTTLHGGYGAGVVYKIDASGQFSTLYSFTGGADGGEPYAGVTLDAEGNLYGTTASGVPNGGRVYELNTAGQLTVLYSFTYGADGDLPFSGVVRDSAGNLYGTASSGGDPACYTWCGVVYKLAPSGDETVLHSFTGGSDGGYPYAGVVLAPAGNLYGTATFGGAAGGGVLYEIKVQ